MTAKAANSGGKPKLSKNLLQMKFMKRTALKAEVEEQEEQRKVEEDADHWTVQDLGHRERLVITEQGYTTFEDLQFGRMSFRGFNPAIEKIMKAQNTAQQDEESERIEKQNAVSDDEMTERYNSLIHTVNKKFNKKAERQSRRDTLEGPPDRKKRNMKFEKAANRARVEEKQAEKAANKARQHEKRAERAANKVRKSEQEAESNDPTPPKKKRKFQKPSD